MPVNPFTQWLITITLVIAFCHSGYSQKESSKTQFNFGLTTGINFSTLRVQHYSAGFSSPVSEPETKTLMGYHLGIPFKVTLNRFFLSGDLLFVNNNSQAINQDSFNNIQYKTDNNFQWLKVPLNFNYIFLQKSKQRFFVGLGFSAGKLLIATTQVSADFGTTTISGDKIDTSDTFIQWSLFGAAQVGGDLLIANRVPITITFTYDHGLNNLMNEPPYNPINSFDYGFVQTKARMNLGSVNVSYFLK